MKSTTKLLLLLILIFGPNPANSQDIKIGGTANIGFSKVTADNSAYSDLKAKFALSGNLGLFREKRITDNSFLGMEVLLVRIEGKEGRDFGPLTTETGELIGEVGEKRKTHLNYLGFPIYCRFETGKFGFKGGFQPMLFLYASAHYESRGEILGEPFNRKEKIKKIKHDRFDIGPKIGVDYSLNTRLRLRADYYHGLNDITSNERVFERKNRQFSFGVQYIFQNEE